MSTQVDGMDPQRPRRQVLVDQVFDAILAKLLDNQVPPGSSLTIDHLAREFGVSITPVREALARIETTGMVRREALRGYSVAPSPTLSEVEDLLEARRVLEPVLAERAVMGGDTALLGDLERINEEQGLAQDKGPTFAGWGRHWRTDGAFHRRIAEAAGSDALLRMFRAIEGPTQRFQLLVHEEMTDFRTLAEHRAIVDAVRRRSAEDARDLMRQHVDGIRERALAVAIFDEDSGRSM